MKEPGGEEGAGTGDGQRQADPRAERLAEHLREERAKLAEATRDLRLALELLERARRRADVIMLLRAQVAELNARERIKGSALIIERTRQELEERGKTMAFMSKKSTDTKGADERTGARADRATRLAEIAAELGAKQAAKAQGVGEIKKGLDCATRDLRAAEARMESPENVNTYVVAKRDVADASARIEYYEAALARAEAAEPLSVEEWDAYRVEIVDLARGLEEEWHERCAPILAELAEARREYESAFNPFMAPTVALNATNPHPRREGALDAPRPRYAGGVSDSPLLGAAYRYWGNVWLASEPAPETAGA